MPYLKNLTPSDLKIAVKNNIPLIFGIGTVEFHGNQLPLGTDLIIVDRMIEEIEKDTHFIVAPSIPFSPTGYMVSGADNGTVDVRIGVFIDYCSEIIKGYKKMGFKRINIVVHHQAVNIKKMLEMSLMQTNLYSANEIYGDGWWSNNKEIEDNCLFKIVPAFKDIYNNSFGGHGGVGETQAVMALSPELVNMENIDLNLWWNSNAIKADKQNSEKEMLKAIETLKQRIINDDGF